MSVTSFYKYYNFPGNIPADGAHCWIRVKYYFSAPFEAVYDAAEMHFVSVSHSIIFPAWCVARWKLVSE